VDILWHETVEQLVGFVLLPLKLFAAFLHQFFERLFKLLHRTEHVVDYVDANNVTNIQHGFTGSKIRILRFSKLKKTRFYSFWLNAIIDTTKIVENVGTLSKFQND